jgi:hypothetical protein
MTFAGYVSVCVQLYCVNCHCLTLHVSAYMAIFRRVIYFYFHMFEGICFAVFFFLPFFLTWSHSTRFHLWGWVKYEVLLLLFMQFFGTVLVLALKHVV